MTTQSVAGVTRPAFPSRAVVTAGMPYGNKGLHFGHVGGVFVPADVMARFLRDRLGAQNVLFVSGTDCFGSPIAEGYRKKCEAGYTGTIVDYVQENHDGQAAALAAYGISLDLFGGSGLGEAAEFHARLTTKLIERLYEKGELLRLSTAQFYDVEAGTFLNGRQVVGRCPVAKCKSEKAYADECDLGHQFDPADLIAPVSQLTGTTPELRPVDNWYFNLPAHLSELEAQVAAWAEDPEVRDVVTNTMRESLAAPVIYIKNEMRDELEALLGELPPCTVHEPAANQSSFTVEFASWRERDEARGVLETHNLRFRTGKTLLPFRITGNIEWGVAAPALEGLSGLTVWCWPESLWAPISFTQTVLAGAPDGRYSSSDWRDWWASDEAKVFQFIGQDNIYFYCVAQPALFHALDWQLEQTTPVANHHILFMNKKASSSGAIKPPLAAELLDYYEPWQLRAHWTSLGLDAKAVSFAPKAFDTSVSGVNKQTGEEVLVKDDPRVADPALKESAFFTNIFNRLARSCCYGAKSHTNCAIPALEASEEARAAAIEATLAYEQAMYETNLHGALSIAEAFGREANKRWDSASKAASQAGDEAAYAQALADAFDALHTLALLMHPIVPEGCERICGELALDPASFFSWDYAFSPLSSLVEAAGSTLPHAIHELPPRTDFFRAHESQFAKK
jgi:methionyl-tRNA synthetase